MKIKEFVMRINEKINDIASVKNRALSNYELRVGCLYLIEQCVQVRV